MYRFKFIWCQRDHSLCKDAVKNDDTVPLMKLFIKVLTIPLKSLDRILSISALDNENLSKNSCLTSPFSCGSTWRRRRRREKEVHLPGEAPFQPLIGMLLISVIGDIFRLYLAAPPGLRPQKSASDTPTRSSASDRRTRFWSTKFWIPGTLFFFWGRRWASVSSAASTTSIIEHFLPGMRPGAVFSVKRAEIIICDIVDCERKNSKFFGNSLILSARSWLFCKNFCWPLFSSSQKNMILYLISLVKLDAEYLPLSVVTLVGNSVNHPPKYD